MIALLEILFSISLLIPVSLAEMTINENEEIIDENHFNTREVSFTNCQSLESSFRDSLVAQVKESANHHQHLQQCLINTQQSTSGFCNEISQTLNFFKSQIRDFRQASANIHRAVTRRWIENLDPASKTIAQTCFIHDRQITTGNDGSVQRNTLGIEFNGHMRRLRATRDDNFCGALQRRWASALDSQIQLAYENPQSFNLSRQEVRHHKNFKEAPIFGLLSDTSLYSTRLNSHELNRNLSNDMNRIVDLHQRFIERLDGLNTNNMYQVYSFQSEYEAFISELSESQKTLAQRCQQANGWTSDCLPRSASDIRLGLVAGLAQRMSSGRCRSRNLSLLSDFLPIIGLFRAQTQVNESHVGRLSGVYTQAERANLALEASAEFLFNLPIGGLVGSAGGVGARGALRASRRPPRVIHRRLTPRDDLTTQVAREQQRRLSRNLFNRYGVMLAPDGSIFPSTSNSIFARWINARHNQGIKVYVGEEFFSEYSSSVRAFERRGHVYVRPSAFEDEAFLRRALRHEGIVHARNTNRYFDDRLTPETRRLYAGRNIAIVPSGDDTIRGVPVEYRQYYRLDELEAYAGDIRQLIRDNQPTWQIREARVRAVQLAENQYNILRAALTNGQFDTQVLAEHAEITVSIRRGQNNLQVKIPVLGENLTDQSAQAMAREILEERLRFSASEVSRLRALQIGQ